MKTRFSTIDVQAAVSCIRERCLGIRVQTVYDIDAKTYLIRLSQPDQKIVILIESGNRIHTTDFEWPKNAFPSGFAMKLRKHIKSRRLVKIEQIGIDRIVDFQFGSGEAAYHVIIELYDRGNIALTDHEYIILNLLRVRTDADQDVRIAVRERYPLEIARQQEPLMPIERVGEILATFKEGESLRRCLNPHFGYGPALIEHCLLGAGFCGDVKIGKGVNLSEDIDRIYTALKEGEEIMGQCKDILCKGYIIQKQQERIKTDSSSSSDKLLTYQEFHPVLLRQHELAHLVEFPTFDKAVDNFFSQLGSQKLDVKALQQEKAAMKKLENVKKDHERRLEMLHVSQETDQYKAQLIESNIEIVERAIFVLCNMVANAFDWTEIGQMVKEAQVQGDPVAKAIKALKLGSNKFTLFLTDPFEIHEEDEEDGAGDKKQKVKGVLIDIDLGLSPYANARSFYDQKKHAAKKERRTLEASDKALKAAERKTKQALKEVAVVTSIQKVRKTYWFEKFLWFVTSENFLVIAGRDAQQNEIIVKRHLRAGDVYVHADLHGATSCVVKNPTGGPIPPKSLQEAGCMALCYSSGWDSKIVTSAWWVRHDQVSKTAPTGEYLTTGSFMIRGKKNFLPPSQLVMGYTFVFKLDESCVENHLNDRKVKFDDEDMASMWKEKTGDASSPQESEEEVEIEIDISDDVPETASSAGIFETQTSTGSQFPDTSIDLQYVKGETFQFQRGISTLSTASATSGSTALVVEEETFESGDQDGNGDNESQFMSSETGSQSRPLGKQRLTAKQHRDIKKQASRSDEIKHAVPGVDSDSPVGKKEQKPASEDPPQKKRGQKHKMKKIKGKYGDQDEEERQLRMEILGSAGAPKEAKNQKGKKGSKQQQQQKAQARQQEKRLKESPVVLISAEVTPSKAPTVDPPGLAETKTNPDEKDGRVKEMEEDDELQLDATKDNMDYLDALTGCPLPDDLLMFAIPMCAPYSAITNYKFKVKLTPGSGRRGKAARTALHLFVTTKETQQREKDLLKSVKDTELSRNLPGKVKLSAPSLQAHRQKKR